MKKQTGIWLDFKNAFIITLENKSVDVKTIDSDIEDYHVKGGARSKQPWGPMDKTSESKYLGETETSGKKILCSNQRRCETCPYAVYFWTSGGKSWPGKGNDG